MLDEFTLGIVAIFASILILIGWVPQIIQGYKTKKLEDVSKYLVTAIFGGAVLWLIYGIAIKSTAMIFANILTLSVIALIIIGVIRIRRSA